MGPSGALRRLWLWGPVVAYVVLIFYLSSLSQIPWAGGFPDFLEHGAEYLGLALLVARALNDGFRRPLLPRRLLAAFLMCLVCAVADEIWQRFTPNRFSDYMDVLSDSGGAGLGLAALRLAQLILGREDAE